MDRSRHLKMFVLSGIATVLATRAFLALTGYPKLGGSGSGSDLHIAHMLWGGLLMTAGIMLFLGVTGPKVRDWSALVSGAGFGLFIDQVGKQVSTKGYFYAPAAALIYLAFAILVLIAWRRRTAAPSAAEITLSGVGHGVTDAERAEVHRLLDGSQRDEDVALLCLLDTLPRREQRAFGQPIVHALERLAANKRAVTALVMLVVLQGTIRLGRLSAELVAGRSDEPEWNALIAGTAFAALTLALYGLALTRRDPSVMSGALLIDLLPGQVAGFTIYQFSALQDVPLGLLLLCVLSKAAFRGLERRPFLQIMPRWSRQAP